MLSVPHLIVIFVVVLVIFGPEKLPELARNFGKVMVEFRRVTGDLRSTIDGHLRDIEREAEENRIGSAPSVSESKAPSAPPPAIVAAPGIVPAGAPRAASPEPGTEESASSMPADSLHHDLDGANESSLSSEQSPEPEHVREPERVSDVGIRPA